MTEMSGREEQGEEVRSDRSGVPTTVPASPSHKGGQGSGEFQFGSAEISERPTPRYRGTRWNRRGYWIARIRLYGAMQYLGSFDTEEDAARAYDAAAAAHLGPRSRRNFPPREEASCGDQPQ